MGPSMRYWQTDGGILMGMATYDDAVYGLPIVQASTDEFSYLWLRKDWMDALGLANPTTFDDLVTSFCKGGGDDTLILMFFIFLEAGIFSGVANAMGAVSSASNLGLKLLPASMVLPGIFIIGCVLSFAMGTSMGTVSALMPIGIQIANVTGMSMPMVCGAVVGGAMFGDNLSFISDTTIAATRTQGVAMKDKFKANFLMVLPAVIINIVLLFFNSSSTALDESALTWDFIQLIPYILVIVLSLIGINVILAMGAGIAAGLIIGISAWRIPQSSPSWWAAWWP